MYKGHRILAVIPARGGSKGVPRKNIRCIAGRPLLSHTIDQSAGVTELDMVVVSTDDPEIRSVALTDGARVVDRPAALATDEASTESALLHALDNLAASGAGTFDYVVVLEPTSPLRTAHTISLCIRTLIDAPVGDSLLAVRETRENIGRIENGVFRPMVADAPRRRQARSPLYVECSTVYVCRTSYLRRTGTLVSDQWLACIVPSTEAEDINTIEDFARVEYLMTHSKENP